jgi:3-deoxy-D-manno-octulosonate 8-phosphate phosphatase (KDO 8-P phosphatase)
MTLDAERLAVLRRARLLALDVDGTLTDGSIVMSDPREPGARPVEIQRYDVRDGIALLWLARAGITVAWISGRGTEATAARARDLGVEHVALRVADKRAELARLQAHLGIEVADTVAMGDDLPDLALRARAAFFAAPSDARAEVRARADCVTVAAGGRGAVRELSELILRARGAWDGLVDSCAR